MKQVEKDDLAIMTRLQILYCSKSNVRELSFSVATAIGLPVLPEATTMLYFPRSHCRSSVKSNHHTVRSWWPCTGK